MADDWVMSTTEKLVAFILDHGIDAWAKGETIYAVDSSLNTTSRVWSDEVVTLPSSFSEIKIWLGY